MDVNVKYCSTVRGCDDGPDHPPTHYYCGFVQRVPATGQEYGESMIQSVLKVREYRGQTTLPDWTVVEPVPGASLERYEVFDFETGVIIVMWRVPVRELPKNQSVN